MVEQLTEKTLEQEEIIQELEEGKNDLVNISTVILLLSVYSPLSDRVGLPLHDTPFPGVLMKSIGATFFDRMPFLTSTTCVGCNIK